MILSLNDSVKSWSCLVDDKIIFRQNHYSVLSSNVAHERTALAGTLGGLVGLVSLFNYFVMRIKTQTKIEKTETQ
jgi:hypothetical protein